MTGDVFKHVYILLSLVATITDSCYERVYQQLGYCSSFLRFFLETSTQEDS